jgi:hypothetical protein
MALTKTSVGAEIVVSGRLRRRKSPVVASNDIAVGTPATTWA